MTKRIEIGRTVTPTSSPTVTEPEAKPRAEVVRVIPHLTSMIDDAQAIIAIELRHYRKELEQDPDRHLNNTESRIVARHVQSLAVLAAKQRELDEGPDWSQLTDEQLLRLAPDAVKLLRGGKAS